jgi:hypothetical protein
MEQFEISYQLKKEKVEVVKRGLTTLYIIKFTDRAPLVLSRATRFEGGAFWTSIPEGRQQEAEAIGPLIDDYLNEKRTANVLL